VSRPLKASVEERAQLGRGARKEVPRSSHADWTPPSGRPDPVGLLEGQNENRVPWLVPIRHARMRVSPFTFYRGTARIMASDLADTPVSGLTVQLGGDAHLSNFGAYASPERQLVFDANDFDETLAGPWEWDLKRLAVSFTIAGQHLGLRRRDYRRATAQVVRSYREAMAGYAAMGTLELWYDHVSVDDLRSGSDLDPKHLSKRLDRFERRARKKTSLQALKKLTVSVDGRYQIRSNPPVLFPLRDLPAEYDVPVIEALAREGLDAYRTTLNDDRRFLLDRYTMVDIGIKVVGVGSVGTRCLIALFEGRDQDDPLFLQIKQAEASVLEEYLEPSPYDNHGRRVVEGQRLAQAESDIFLGWTERSGGASQFYVRQLRDWKGSVETTAATPRQLRFYANLCGQTMARGHARSGDAVALAAYMGKGTALDKAVTDFAEAYSVQNMKDYNYFQAAIEDGRLEASETFK
jgi:uncharacterized protein (DUF2252 family)